MSKETPQISVNFCTYPQYEPFPDTVINLGEINTAQLNQLMDAAANNPRQSHQCITEMNIKFSDRISFDTTWGARRRRMLELSNLFYLYDVRNPKFRAPCITGEHLPQTSDAMIRTCAHNLRCGNCRDEFIRKTLGAMLFPQHYANEKQK